MTRQEVKEIMPIIQAYADGKVIQYSPNKGNTWYDVAEDVNHDINIGVFEYRIKPEPKYRPFKDADECWNEMLKHQPFGWLKDKSSDDYYVLLTYIDGNNIGLNGNNGWDFVEVMTGYTFADDQPFGIKESEG